jgi:Fe-S cluster assembly ATP-binding protein
MLKIEELNLKKGEKRILNNVSFEVADGEIFGVLGTNGAGKSSLAYVLMGSFGYISDSGKITFNGIDITHKPIDERASLGITMAWQEPARFEGISIIDFILLGSKEKGQTLAESYMDNMRLTVSEYRTRQVDKTLSGGERKKIELASVIAMKPKLAILDEPDSGIDMLSQEAVIHLIREIKGYGGSVILITHDEEVVKIADRAALMCSGLAFKIGSPSEIIDYYKEHCKPCPTKRYPSQEDGR